MIFPPVFAGVYLTHLTLLRLPYYWDEAGYYIPAAYDLFRSGSLIPSSTLSNAHPPLPSLYLALWWRASGFTPAVTRTAMCMVAAIALLAVYRLGIVLTGRPQVAVAATVLTALYPIWFVQSTLAHADMFAAAGTLWGMVFAFAALLPAEDKSLPNIQIAASAVCFATAALCKETAVVTPLAIALWEIYTALSRAPALERRRQHLRLGLALFSPALPLLGWYAYHRYRTGYIFGNPQYLRYNAVQTFTPPRILLALLHRIFHITAHMNMFVPVLCMLGAMLLPPLHERDGSPRSRISPASQAVLYVVLAANAIFFSVIGGALLTRYLLPLYPLVLLLAVSTFRRRVRYWGGLVGLSAVAFLLGLWVNPPYRFAPEDNLSYADVIRLQQRAIHQIAVHFPSSTILTAWPATDELTKPELGYVRKPMPVVAIDNFSLTEIQKAAASSQDYTVGLAFSTKYDPPQLFFSLGARNEALDGRFFDFHRDLEPAAIAHLLDGTVFWRGDRNGEWAAVLHFNRAELAAITPGPAPQKPSQRPPEL
jgi:Dolichyl-phosphate-mannose-protein mannosyltransferase